MSVVKIPTHKLNQKEQLNAIDLIPKFKATGHKSVTYNQQKPLRVQEDFIPGIMNDAIQRNMALKTKGCREEPFSTRLIFRRFKEDVKASDCCPQTGVFRHEKKGLIYDTNKPNNLRLMPLANSFYAGLNNSIQMVL